jgi:hypothetical protein
MVDIYSQLVAGRSTIILSVIGSALFWIILLLLKYIFNTICNIVKISTKNSVVNNKFREYLYKKYTCSNGLAYYPQGYFITFYNVFKYLILGIVFLSVSILIGRINEMGLTIGIVGAIYNFLLALRWVSPSSKWDSKNPLDRWISIAELEKQLFGDIEKDTKGWVEKFSIEKKSGDQSKNNLERV